jgi:hypothetical protein
MKRKMLFTVFYLLIAVALLGIVTVFALDAGSLTWWTVSGGAASSTGGSYNLSGSIGQPDAGTSTGGTYALVGGLWSGVNNPPTMYKLFLPLILR